jgi:hypothetical protein
LPVKVFQVSQYGFAPVRGDKAAGEAAVTADESGYSLHHQGLEDLVVFLFREDKIGVGVDINEAGSNNSTAGVNNIFSLSTAKIAYLRDLPFPNADIGAVAGFAGTVGNGPIPDHCIEHCNHPFSDYWFVFLFNNFQS